MCPSRSAGAIRWRCTSRSTRISERGNHMTTIYFGWAMQSTYSGQKSGYSVFAVNLVIPGAGGLQWWLPNHALIIKGSDALTAFGGLLRPWRWGANDWEAR